LLNGHGEQPHGVHGEGESEDSGKRGEEDAFDQQLPDDEPTGRAEGDADRDLARTTCGTCQEYVSISAKRLRASLPDVLERVRKGTRFTATYRSKPAIRRHS
jgi:hypothetical protein